MVEMALVLPVFLLIVMATIDFGWALRSYIVITNSAREGARLGVIGATEDEIVSRVINKSGNMLEDENVQVVGARTDPGNPLTVEVKYDHHYISPLGTFIEFVSGGAVPNPLPLSSSTTMRME